MLILYFLTINALGFLLMLVDKHKARKNRWRIPEATLMGVAVLGGSIGSVAGMLVFHHKTQHWYFQVFMPLITLLQMAALLTLAIFKMGWL